MYIGEWTKLFHGIGSILKVIPESLKIALSKILSIFTFLNKN